MVNIDSEFYRPADKNNWIGRKDGALKERFYQIIDLQTPSHFATLELTTQKTGVILGFACDEGVFRNQGRIGASLGPQALRKALGNMPLSENLLENFALFDLGDVICVNQDLEKTQQHLGKIIESIMEKGGLPIVLGGGHEVAFGHYLGLHHNKANDNFAIVNVDAHFDMRPMLNNQLGTSGSAFLQIAQLRKENQLPFNYYCLGIKQTSNTHSLFQTAKEWGVKYLTCEDMLTDEQTTARFIEKILDQHDSFYLTICLDAFAASVAPGVSAASPFGLEPLQVLSAIRQLASSGKVVALDIAELAPNFDQDNITAKLAAICVTEFLYAWRVSRS